MPRLFSSAHIIKVLVRNSFVFVSQKGSHAKYRKFIDGSVYTVIVPSPRKEIPVGTFRSIVRQSGLSIGEF